MSSASTHPALTPPSTALDYYFEVSLYLLVLTGFATLASTGGLDLPTTLLVGISLLIRGYMVAKRHVMVVSERWTTQLTIFYFAFFACDFMLFSRAFLPATVHLALFAVVVRTFSLRRERDYVLLSILAFLMVLVSAVLTVDSVFVLCFAAFMLMAVSTFVLLEMRRSARSASIQSGISNDPRERKRLAISIARVAPALMLMILAGATAVFFLLPRMSAGYLGGYSFGTDFSSGFSDHVQLGRIGEIQQSNAVVMHVQVEGDSEGRFDLRWRGVSLSRFDGHTWSNPHEQYMLPRQADNSFPVPNFGTLIEANAPVDHPPAHFIHYRVLMEPIGTNVFFLAPWPRRVSGDYRMVAVDAGAALYDLDNQRAVSLYEADSDISAPTAAQLRTAGLAYPPQVYDRYLQLPQLDPRIAPMAAQIAGSRSNYDKAAAIENYLRTRFGYTLQLPKTEPTDPLAQFLFERKQGHCEYFASSMAVMLRTLGIPSRVVNGFRSDEFNDVTGNYVVRAKDAHAWVEAYFPGYGWQTFDPTPAGSAGTPQGWSRVMLYVDAAASFWREWIVSYDTSHQSVLGQVALSGTRSMWERARIWGHTHYESMLAWARQGQKRAERAPGKWTGIGIGLGIALLLVGNLRRIMHLIQEMRLRSHPERSPELAATMWYRRMARLLARRGVPKPAAQTSQEFVRKIEDERLRDRVAHFTEAYESARFGDSAEAAQRLPELCEEIELALKK